MMGMGQAQSRAPQQADPAAAQQPPMDDPEGETTPEEQAQYETVVRNAEQLIYDEQDQPRKEIMDSLSANQDPLQAVASTAVMVAASLEQSAEQAGQPISDEVLQGAADEIVSMLCDLASEAGIHDFTDKETEGAYFLALDTYREMNPTGRINPDDLKQQFGSLMEADQQGKLGEVLPGLPQGQPEPQEQPPADRPRLPGGR